MSAACVTIVKVTTSDQRDIQAPTAAPLLSAQTLLGAAPALTGILLGSLYVLGLLINGSRLIDAEQTAVDTMSLIPLQDHLTTSLGLLVAEPIIVIMIVAAAVVAVFADRIFLRPRDETPQPTEKDPAWLRNAPRILPIVVLGLTTPLPAAVGYVLLFTSLEYGARHLVKVDRGFPSLTRLIACLAIALILIETANLYFDPVRAPSATIVDGRGERITGKLLAHANGNYYVATGERRYRAIADSDLRTVRLESQKRERSRSIMDFALGRDGT